LSLREQKKRLLQRLLKEGIVSDERVITAFIKVPREEFVPKEYRDLAYYDHPLPIGFGQTISAPHMVLIMTEKLDVHEGMKVLEVGTGSGYQAAILAEMVSGNNDKSRNGFVISIERIKELAERAIENLRRTGYLDRVKVIIGDGSKGYAPEAPYDRIIVTAAAPKVPKSLVRQLKVGGKMVIPVGDTYYQELYVIEKTGEEKIKIKKDVPCAFVPLIGEEGW
jgi:protein-L-isoaspartate(D-aspartate) O-methyltransferase